MYEIFRFTGHLRNPLVLESDKKKVKKLGGHDV